MWFSGKNLQSWACIKNKEQNFSSKRRQLTSSNKTDEINGETHTITLDRSWPQGKRTQYSRGHPNQHPPATPCSRSVQRQIPYLGISWQTDLLTSLDAILLMRMASQNSRFYSQRTWQAEDLCHWLEGGQAAGDGSPYKQLGIKSTHRGRADYSLNSNPGSY